MENSINQLRNNNLSSSSSNMNTHSFGQAYDKNSS